MLQIKLKKEMKKEKKKIFQNCHDEKSLIKVEVTILTEFGWDAQLYFLNWELTEICEEI